MHRFNTNHKSCTPIGIDLDYHEFRAVQYKSPNSSSPAALATIPRAGSRSLIPSTQELELLRTTLSQRGFNGDRVAIAVPKECSSFHILDLPPEGSGAPIEKLALLETQRSGAHKSSDLQIGFWKLPANEAPSKFQSPYYTVACETEPLDQIIDLFESAGLLPVSVEPIETAISKSLSIHNEFTQDTIHSIVEIGWDHSWAIITLGDTPVYTRRIEHSVSRIRRSLIDDHAMPANSIEYLWDPQASAHLTDSPINRILASLLTPMLSDIVEQLDTALTYVSQQHRFAPFGLVFRSGYFAHLDQTANAIAQRTGMPTIELNAISKGNDQDIGTDSAFELLKSPRINIASGLAKGAA